MNDAVINYRFLCRGGLAAALAAVNEIPLKREMVVEIDTRRFKFGDGVTAYNALPYAVATPTAMAVINHGDATPAPVLDLGPSAVEVMQISLQVEEAFDAIDARLALGTVDSVDVLLPGIEGLLGSVGIYEFSPRVEVPANTSVIATLTHAGAGTHGRAQVVINTIPLN